jgi:hypothetical protein
VETPSSYSPPPPPPVPARRSGTRIVAIVCIAFVVLIGGCVSMFAAGMKTARTAQAPAEQFLAHLEAGDLPAARQMLSSATRNTATEDAIRDVLDVLAKRRGKPTGHAGPKGFRTNQFNGVTRVELTYTERFEKGSETPVRLVLLQEGGAWKVESFNFSL